MRKLDLSINHILILDDDELNNSLVKEIISDLVTVTTIASETSGWDALEYLKQKKAVGDFPDLIIVDVKMPEMDGFEFLDRYEGEFFHEFKKTKIAVATSSHREYDKMRANQYPSVNLFVNKPLDELKLSYVFKALIG